MKTNLVPKIFRTDLTAGLLGWMVLTGTSLCAQDIEFVTQPASQGVPAGSNATFSVEVTGTEPISYQWRFNGAPLTGATNTTLELTNVTPYMNGYYNVVVTNAAGSATSQVAQLIVYAKLWTGAGDGISWNNPTNWTGNSVPSSTDGIYIGATNITVTNFPGGTLLSLQCDCSLAISGSVTVNGKVQIGQCVYLAPSIGITAFGFGASFSCMDPVVGDQVSFSAQQGGVISLPGLTSYTSLTGSSISASGIGSVVSLPDVQTIRGPSSNDRYLYIQASSGGRISLSGIKMIHGSSSGGTTGARGVQISVDGVGSVINLSGLQSFVCWNNDRSAANSAISQGHYGQVVLSSLSYAEAVNLSASYGGTMSLPALTNYVGNIDTAYSGSFSASGLDTVLDAPALLTIRGPNYAHNVWGGSKYTSLSVSSGARLNLSAVRTIYGSSSGGDSNSRGVQVSADGVG